MSLIFQTQPQPPSLSQNEESKSPRSAKSECSESTINSEQQIYDGIQQLEKRLTQQDPYFRNLLKKDNEFSLSPDFLNGKKINIKMRTRLIKWLQQLIEQYGFKLETYFLTVTIVDKYLEKSMESSKSLQLIGACCLYIASKISETKLVTPEVYIYSSGDSFDIPSMIAKQKEILQALSFNTSFPHVTKFIKTLGNLNNLQYQQSERILIMLEHSVQSYQYSRLQLARMIILLVKSGCSATTPQELNNQVNRLQNLLDF